MLTHDVAPLGDIRHDCLLACLPMTSQLLSRAERPAASDRDTEAEDGVDRPGTSGQGTEQEEGNADSAEEPSQPGERTPVQLSWRLMPSVCVLWKHPPFRYLINCDCMKRNKASGMLSRTRGTDRWSTLKLSKGVRTETRHYMFNLTL